MVRTVEAVVEPGGRVRLLEPLTLTKVHRALVTILEERVDEEGVGGKNDDASAEASLRGMHGSELLRFAGTISPDDLDLMERVVEKECGPADRSP